MQVPLFPPHGDRDANQEDKAGRPKTRRRASGISTSDVILSSHFGDNSLVFPQILQLHVAEGAMIADITFGKGVFWKCIPEGKYNLKASDLKLGMDWTSLPYEDGSMDAVVFDPPYMEGLYRKSKDALAGSGSHSAFQEAYSNGQVQDEKKELKYHDAVLNAYLSPLNEVNRVLRDGGKFIVKCQDEVSANRQKLTHVEIIWAYEHRNFYCKDLFVVTRVNRPSVARLVKQEHARKNHSYFLVFEKQSQRRALSYSNFSAWLRAQAT